MLFDFLLNSANLWWLFIYAMTGIIVGFCAGLFGIGGGAIMVPLLTSVFIWQDFNWGQPFHIALVTSMLCIIPTSTSSMLAHHKHQAIHWNLVKIFTPGILFGALIASYIITHVNDFLLSLIFTVFIGYVALSLFLEIAPQNTRDLPNYFTLRLVGGGIGIISTFFSIGGGTLTVPYLIAHKIEIRNAVATSATLGVPISLFASIGHLINNSQSFSSDTNLLGYIYLPAAIIISITSIVTTRYGAKMAHQLPAKSLKKAFGLFLLLITLKMLFDLFGYSLK